MSSEATPGGGVRAWSGVALVVLVAFGIAWGLQLRRESQQHELIQALRALTQGGGLQMLSRSDCAECERSRQWFESEQIRLEVCLLDGPGACAQALRRQLVPHGPYAGHPASHLGGARHRHATDRKDGDFT